METKHKILYEYLLDGSRIHKFNSDNWSRLRLYECIIKYHPTFMHPYGFGFRSSGDDDAEFIIYLLKDYKVKFFKKLKLKLLGRYGPVAKRKGT